MSDLQDTMTRQALAAQKFTRKHFVVELDFSLASLDELDGQFRAVAYALRGGASPENQAQLIDLWGAYLGEMLRRQADAEWVDTGDAAPDRFAVRRGPTTTRPFAAVARRFHSSDSPSLRAVFDEWVARLTA